MACTAHKGECLIIDWHGCIFRFSLGGLSFIQASSHSHKVSPCSPFPPIVFCCTRICLHYLESYHCQTWWQLAVHEPQEPLVMKELKLQTTIGMVVAASVVKLLDESMVAWHPHKDKTGGLQHISFILRKLEPLGTEFKSMICSLTSINCLFVYYLIAFFGLLFTYTFLMF
jgi:hypothetical protein